MRLSADHPLAAKERIALAELAGESWMTLVEDDDGGPEALVAACARAGFARCSGTGWPTARCTTT